LAVVYRRGDLVDIEDLVVASKASISSEAGTLATTVNPSRA